MLFLLSLMMIVGIIFLCLLAGVFFWMMSLSKPEKNPVQEDNLNDELLFDPLTGRKMTLEEAEQGIVVESVSPRIKSDQEIEENYSDDLKEVEYILRDFIQSGIDETYFEDEDVGFDRLFAQSEYARGLNTKQIHHLWEFRPGLFFGLVYVSYSLQGSAHDYQSFAVIEDQSDISAFATIPDAYVELIDDTVLIRLPKAISHAGFKEFVEEVSSRMRGGR
jgi:hypothetical protein